MKECTQIRGIWAALALMLGGVVSIGTWAGDKQWMPRSVAMHEHKQLAQTTQQYRYEDLIFQIRSAIADLEIQIGYASKAQERQMLRARIKVKEGQIKAIQDKMQGRYK